MTTQARKPRGNNYIWRVGLAALVALPAVAFAAEQPRFKPGFNLFSREQDAQVGREGVAQVEKEVPW